VKEDTSVMTLKELRKSKGFTQRQVAEAAGITRSRLARLEKGVALTRLAACAEQLGGTLEVAVTFGEKRVIVTPQKG
jgi:transcriptional regulator with XRE-family HTH domain